MIEFQSVSSGGGGSDLVTKLCQTLPPQELYPARLLRPRDSPGTNTGVGCHFLLQRSSHFRNQTQLSGIAGIFFTN